MLIPGLMASGTTASGTMHVYWATALQASPCLSHLHHARPDKKPKVRASSVCPGKLAGVSILAFSNGKCAGDESRGAWSWITIFLCLSRLAVVWSLRGSSFELADAAVKRPLETFEELAWDHAAIQLQFSRAGRYVGACLLESGPHTAMACVEFLGLQKHCNWGAVLQNFR